MKIEVGMYVRTDLGEIVQIVNMVVNSPLKDIRYITYPGTEWTYFDDKHDGIVKSSHNIIDLIEVGDYVNGYRVIAIIDCELRVDGFSWGTNIIKDYDIETVVTHEQFESMAYKVVK